MLLRLPRPTLFPYTTLFRSDARGHDAGHGTRHRRQERNERLTTETAAGHEPVHQEGRPRHVATVLQDGEERSEEHTSELQSRQYLVCRLLLEKKKQDT